MISPEIETLIKSSNQRELLIDLKARIREGSFKPTEEDIDHLILLLRAQDAKARKNVAQILGMLHVQRAQEPLMKSLQIETTEFVKAEYIKALKSLDIESVRAKLEALRFELGQAPVTSDNKKHVDEQLMAFNELLGSKVVTHKFTGWHVPSEVILTTQKGVSKPTYDSVYSSAKRMMNIGVCAKLNSLEDVKNLRTYKEILFILPNCKKLSADPDEAAASLAKGELLGFLDKRHEDKGPWAYRVTFMAGPDERKRSNYIKRFTGELARLSGGYFINKTTDYEFEMRLFENKEGSYTLLIKLLTMKDDRFDYRKEVVASSIRPDLAATLIHLSGDYLKSNIQVLDPFCGVGTMLIERFKYRRANPMYGVDTFGEAITKAKINATAAGCEAYFVNRDYFDFKHNYQFEEIITNMPFATRKEDEEKIRDLYKKFFEYSKKLLKKGSFLILYVRDIDSARTFSRKCGYLMEKEMMISEKEKSYLCIYRHK